MKHGRHFCRRRQKKHAMSEKPHLNNWEYEKGDDRMDKVEFYEIHAAKIVGREGGPVLDSLNSHFCLGPDEMEEVARLAASAPKLRDYIADMISLLGIVGIEEPFIFDGKKLLDDCGAGIEWMGCPRRASKISVDVDRWIPRWSTDVEDQKLKNDEMNVQRAQDGIGLLSELHGCWTWDCRPPKVCSYCGSAHPKHALGLIKEGWEVSQAVGSTDKFYINPPGYAQHIAKSLHRHRPAPKYRVPCPPVKAHIEHFDQEQIANVLKETCFGQRQRF